MHRSSVLVSVAVSLCIWVTGQVLAFGVDVCFNDPAQEPNPIRNCIDVGEMCRKQPLPPVKELRCRLRATADSLSGLSGGNAIIGGRSLLHSDSLYLMAQVMGYSPWQAYQMMIYAEATDQSTYEPFDQNGAPMMSETDIETCHSSGMLSAVSCLGITPVLYGLYKFNDETGGQLLHLHARFGADATQPQATGFPTDYFSLENAGQEMLLTNLRAWAFGERDDLCVSGVTESPDDPLAACIESGWLDFPMNFFGFAIAAAVPFRADLGTFIVHDRDGLTVKSDSADFSAYIPHDAGLARMGIYLHSLGDRVSHHKCTDVSWFYEVVEGRYNSVYPPRECGQGGHFLWHVWEQGTDQSKITDAEFRTMEVALGLMWDELLERGTELGFVVNPSVELEKSGVITNLVSILGEFDPTTRLDRLTNDIESRGLTPLPGHGRFRNETLETWLEVVEAEFE